MEEKAKLLAGEFSKRAKFLDELAKSTGGLRSVTEAHFAGQAEAYHEAARLVLALVCESARPGDVSKSQ